MHSLKGQVFFKCKLHYGTGKKMKNLKNKNLKDISLTSKECTFCHVESIRSSWKEAIETHGYYIYEMENCEWLQSFKDVLLKNVFGWHLKKILLKCFKWPYSTFWRKYFDFDFF